MEILIFLLVILLENIRFFIKHAEIIIPLIIIFIIWLKFVHPRIKEEREKQKFKFNEYDNYEKIEQFQIENKQIENELEKTTKSRLIRNNKEQILEGVPISAILEEDNSFDPELFKKWSKNIFLYLQFAKKEELKQIKHCIADEFYERKIQVLKDFERDNLELRRENLLIEEIKIFDYSKWLDKAQIKVYIKARLKEYIINQETQEVLRGNYKKTCERGFILTFQKKDIEQQVGFINNCESCGAEISETEFGRCEYCGSLVNPIRYNWTLIKYEVI